VRFAGRKEYNADTSIRWQKGLASRVLLGAPSGASQPQASMNWCTTQGSARDHGAHGRRNFPNLHCGATASEAASHGTAGRASLWVKTRAYRTQTDESFSPNCQIGRLTDRF